MKLFKLIAIIMFTLTIAISLYAYFNNNEAYTPILITIALILLVFGLVMQFIAWIVKKNLRD